MTIDPRLPDEPFPHPCWRDHYGVNLRFERATVGVTRVGEAQFEKHMARDCREMLRVDLTLNMWQVVSPTIVDTRDEELEYTSRFQRFKDRAYSWWGDTFPGMEAYMRTVSPPRRFVTKVTEHHTRQYWFPTLDFGAPQEARYIDVHMLASGDKDKQRAVLARDRLAMVYGSMRKRLEGMPELEGLPTAREVIEYADRCFPS